jgi:hypothetical protein
VWAVEEMSLDVLLKVSGISSASKGMQDDASNKTHLPKENLFIPLRDAGRETNILLLISYS